jgi:mono/diheme cytochrome c family protein
MDDVTRFAVAVGIVVAVVVLLGASPHATTTTETDAQRERGRYLTHDVAMCVQCHTPRNENGVLIEEQLFQGARVPVAQPPWTTDWAAEAPALAGLPGREEEFLISVLTTGHRPTGRVPQPPMPPFRMSHEDAEAVAAYLRSLPGAGEAP